MTNSQPSAESACDHEFTFLRSEEQNIGYDRNPLYLVQDVFFCEKCLTYRRVDVRKERPVDCYSNGRRQVVERMT